jgi:regulatory protein
MSKNPVYNEALNSLLSYCNYRERCTSEVKQKLAGIEISEEDKTKLINELKEFSILDDQRFANAFVSGKVKIKKWGKNKIRAALRIKQIDQNLIENAFSQNIDLTNYKNQLEYLFVQKWGSLKNKEDIKTKAKLYRFLYGKGYESALITKLFEKHFN